MITRKYHSDQAELNPAELSEMEQTKLTATKVLANRRNLDIDTFTEIIENKLRVLQMAEMDNPNTKNKIITEETPKTEESAVNVVQITEQVLNTNKNNNVRKETLNIEEAALAMRHVLETKEMQPDLATEQKIINDNNFDDYIEVKEVVPMVEDAMVVLKDDKLEVLVITE